MSKHFFPLTGNPPCPHCGQPEGVQIDLGSTGYRVSSGFEHKPECPMLRCPHGTLWSEDCQQCYDDDISNSEEYQSE